MQGLGLERIKNHLMDGITRFIICFICGYIEMSLFGGIIFTDSVVIFSFIFLTVPKLLEGRVFKNKD
jgi:hypothetical protein